MSDPLSFFSQDFTTIEASDGMEKGALPRQYAKMKMEEVTFEVSKNDKPQFNFRFRCDEKFALTPKQGGFVRFYPSGKNQSKFDGLTRRLGLGRIIQRFGEPTKPEDVREPIPKDQWKVIGDQLATAMTNREILLELAVESDAGGIYSDKNVFQTFYEMTPANLAAVAEGGGDPAKIQEKSRKTATGRERFLAVKGASGGSVSGAPTAVID